MTLICIDNCKFAIKNTKLFALRRIFYLNYCGLYTRCFINISNRREIFLIEEIEAHFLRFCSRVITEIVISREVFRALHTSTDVEEAFVILEDFFKGDL